uniref:Putative transposase n=1 Tax=Candidatus Kentrum sp. LFY TaxID=2126342 RepID=A0A450UEH8_9GAMM|nr:MAG: putative transposase [Candidatus Kentron sp. LFY]
MTASVARTARVLPFAAPRPRGTLVKRAEGGGLLPVANVIRLRERDPWREATDDAREEAVSREIVVLYVIRLMEEGMSRNRAVDLLRVRARDGALPTHTAKALDLASRSGRGIPSRSTLCDWCAKYRENGVAALVPDHKGRVVEARGWWGPALEYYNQPGKPDMAAVHRRIREVDGIDISYEQVRRYLTGQHQRVGMYSPIRIGRRLYRLTRQKYIERCTRNALPGDVYVADGYRADVWLAHPVTGDLWRPELTVAMDMRSRVIVGWRADEHEGTAAVQNMWAECFHRWRHVPPILYIDNGSGYKNKLMDDGLTGFYIRAGVQQIIHAIPGNPHGKGWIERFFRTVRDDFLKLWRPACYCGPDMSGEALGDTLKETRRALKAGRRILPTLEEFTADFDAWIGRYVHRPHPEDKDQSRIEVWSRLVPIPSERSLVELKYQAAILTVSRAMLAHGKRRYRHPDLEAFNGRKVVLEYDLADDETAVVRTQEGRWICDAHLVGVRDAVAGSRLEEKRLARAKDALRRLDKKKREQIARAGIVMDADDVVDGVRDALPDHESRSEYDLFEHPND